MAHHEDLRCKWHHGLRHLLRYKGNLIKEYFANYFLNQINCRFDLQNNRMEVLSNNVEPWTMTLIDTGENTMTGGRLKRVRDNSGDETFCFTTGTVSVMSTFETRRLPSSTEVLATLTAVAAPGPLWRTHVGRTQTHVNSFREKPGGEGAWINGGFFVLEPGVFDYIE